MDEFKPLIADDIISGQMGQIILTINGDRRVAAEIKKITADISKTKASTKVLGRKTAVSKTTGAENKGSVAYFVVDSFWLNQAVNFVKTGKDVPMDILVTNKDSQNEDRTGSESVLLKGCDFNSWTVINVDVDSEFPERTSEFTFDDIDILQSFNERK